MSAADEMYHCGRSGWSKLDWLQTSQDSGTIGPGIYLTPDKEWLLDSQFCRRKGISLYTVQVRWKKTVVHNKPVEDTLPKLMPLLNPLLDKVEARIGHRPNWNVGDALGALVREYGGPSFVKMMKPIGVVGTRGFFSQAAEYAIFDVSALKIVGEDPNPRKVSAYSYDRR